MKSHFDTCSVVKIVVDDDVASSVVVPLVVVAVIVDVVLVSNFYLNFVNNPNLPTFKIETF